MRDKRGGYKPRFGLSRGIPEISVIPQGGWFLEADLDSFYSDKLTIRISIYIRKNAR